MIQLALLHSFRFIKSNNRLNKLIKIHMKPWLWIEETKSRILKWSCKIIFTKASQVKELPGTRLCCARRARGGCGVEISIRVTATERSTFSPCYLLLSSGVVLVVTMPRDRHTSAIRPCWRLFDLCPEAAHMPSRTELPGTRLLCVDGMTAESGWNLVHQEVGASDSSDLWPFFLFWMLFFWPRWVFFYNYFVCFKPRTTSNKTFVLCK